MATITQSQADTGSYDLHHFEQTVRSLLARIRGIEEITTENGSISGTPCSLTTFASSLSEIGKTAEAEALENVHAKVIDRKAFGGLGLKDSAQATADQCDEILFLVEAHLEAINSRERTQSFLSIRPSPASGTRPMTLAQKILAQHVLGTKPAQGLSAGDVVRVGVDWIMASDLSWEGMARTHEELDSPGIWRNDRFWLAGDHVVHPDVAHVPKVKHMVEVAEKAKKDFKMTEYQGMNYTIMHTEFVRERLEPGMLALGSDSHTCSGGAVGCLAIGMGSADVMMALSLGETWLKIPDSIYIEFVGEPSFGVSGKDVILHILGELKRNTVAAERIVEFGGNGAHQLSVDARFAICNM
jgi:hypothetical protein